MARRVAANLQSIIFPPSIKPPFQLLSDDLTLIVNSTRVGLKVRFESTQADAELIQFYLSEYFDSPGALIPVKFPRSKTGEMVKIDGVIGDQTDAAILFYQREVLKARGDGIVSPPIVAAGPTNLSTGPSLTISSYTQARTVLSLSASWVAFHPGMDILDSDKLQNANHLRGQLTKGRPQPI